MSSRPLYFCLLFMPFILQSQSIVQTARGKVFDKATQQPLAGALVSVSGAGPAAGAVTDENGRFTLEAVPVGRQAFRCQYLGYETYESEEVIVSSVKEVELEIALEKKVFTTQEVEVVPYAYASSPVNGLALVSARPFTAEETERIPAGVYDPGRMALSLPGVQQGSDENENKIIIRGNSSIGVLWRLEGIDIPNPNHFASPGSSGGGITIFSSQLLGRSDFLTGAFPAEYGNALSGVFDIRFRRGNTEEREHRARLSIIGLDIATEGPLRKGRSSYLVNYRYSTLGILNQLGFNLVGERVDNNFQDLSFNLAFNGKNKNTFFTVFGIAGDSEEHYLPVESPANRDPAVADHWEDRYNRSKMGAAGFTFTQLLNEKSYFKAVVAGASGVISRDYDTLSLDQVPFKYDLQRYQDGRISASATYYNELSSRAHLKTGLIFHQIHFDFFKETAPRRPSDVTIGQPARQISTLGNGNTQSAQAYANLNCRVNEKLELNVGVHGLLFTLNNSWSLEPRASFRYRPNGRQSISLAYGLHSKILPFTAFFYAPEGQGPSTAPPANPNKNLSLLKAHHLVLAYQYHFGRGVRAEAEVYWQRLFNVPVGIGDNSNYWMLNDQGRLLEFELVSEGKGLNYGVDLALEKRFSNNIFFLLTASLFDSRFEIDGYKRNTRFNSRFVSAYTLGREFVLKKNAILQAGLRLMANGGFRYSPYDPARSQAEGRFIPLKGREWSEQVDNYLRLDGRAAFRKDKDTYSYTVSLDIQNMTNRFNPHSVRYDATNNALQFRRHSGGLIPVLSFSLDL
ncbi:MAG: TonB-dependent receptor, partial [Phaeodactylibacter sp.]|nr:TonB-dependent receptor [Phaeodactylibacter sp.]MCB9049659.1 TonB-dependent receptor [Lewinellaceae bacterium]